MLRLSDVHASHGAATVLHGVGLEIAAGETVALLGPNGAGKSTLLRCIAGLTRLDAGQVRTEGRVVPILELGVGFRADLDGWENLRLTARLMGLTDAETAAATDAIVALSGVETAMGRPIQQWSSGMRARPSARSETSCPATSSRSIPTRT